MTFIRFLGIDVAKNKIDIYDSHSDTVSTISNNKSAIKKFFEGIPSDGVLCIMENTGGYELTVLRELMNAGFAIHKTDNFKVKAYMRSLGLKAKTDAIDAKALAQYGKERQADLKLSEDVDPTDGELRQLVKYLEELKRIRAAEKNKIKSGGFGSIQGIIANTIARLDELIKRLEEEIRKKSKKNRNLLNALTDYKGISWTTAVNLIAYLPELGQISGKEIASLAGLAPFAKDSGMYHGYRSTRGGRPIVKKTLFMAALTATRFNPEISKFYQRLRKAGKKPMVAIVASMRKMLLQLNAITRNIKERQLEKERRSFHVPAL